MKKLNLILCLLIAGLNTASAQTAKINKDTVTYGASKIYPQKVVQLLYGSTGTKDFAYVFVGSGWTTGVHPLNADNAKGTVLITKVYKMQGKCYAIGTLQETQGLQAKRITINIEAAVDNKEIKED